MSVNDKGLRAEKDKKWEQVQIKAFTLWINSTLEPLGHKIEVMPDDLTDGVALCLFLEEVSHKKLSRWSRKPALRVHKIENLSIALKFVQGELGVRLVGIGPEDIADGKLKLSLGLLWSLFVKLRIDTISESGHTALDGLLSWVKNMTEGYENVEINNFKDSFNDGMAFAALVHAMNPDAIDFNSLDPKDVEHNLNHAFEMAEKKLGIPRLLEVEDVMNGSVDERAMILYNSLFFHAWNADAEKREIRKEKESVAAQLERIGKENSDLKTENAELRQAVDDKDARIAALEAEVAFLRKANHEGNELRKALEEKIRILQGLLDANEAAIRAADGAGAGDRAGAGADGSGADGSGASGSDADGSDAAGSGSRGVGGSSVGSSSGSDLDNLLADLENERDGLLSDQEAKDRYLSELEARRIRLNENMESLRKQVEAEIKKRKEQETIISELREALKAMKSKEIVHTQARIGLDVLKSNLEEHLEDLYRWRELNRVEGDDFTEFDLAEVVEDLSNKSFEEQLTNLDGRLQDENRTLARVLKLQEDKEYLEDSILQAGWLVMKGRKDWRRRWFILTDNRLTFFEDESCEKESGSVEITGDCAVVRQMAVTDEETNKKLWPLKVTVSDKKLFLRAETKKERHSWFSVLSSKISLLKYLKTCEESGERPDTRLVGVLKANSVPSIYFANRDVSPSFVSALSKGILGRDELDELAIVNSSLDDTNFSELIGAIAKLPHLKRFNFSKNKISSSTTEAFVGAITFKTLEDFDVSNNQLDDEFLCAFAAQLNESANLNSLILDGNQFSAAGVKALTDALTSEQSSSALPELCFNNNKLGDDGVQALLPLFSKFSFKKIHLAGNGISDSGVVALADALKSSPVEELNFSHNNITSKGASALGELMKSNTRLHSIVLSGNKGLLVDKESSNLFTASEFVFADLTLSRA
jgi:peptidoglycan hydrolase CwlO-like protein